jgi:uncharacterized protein YabN with tetrapyrrole methylase and pyrophosphatase domain
VNEELLEFKEAAEAAGVHDTVANVEAAHGTSAEVEAELGDLLFSIANLCRFMGVDPSQALQRTNLKFVTRFKYIEKCMKENGKVMNKENVEMMDNFWKDAKLKEKV